MTVQNGMRFALSLKFYLQAPKIFRAGKMRYRIIHVLSLMHYACIRRLAPCIRRARRSQMAWVRTD